VGIGGWLLFFCLQLFVLNPAVVDQRAVAAARCFLIVAVVGYLLLVSLPFVFSFSGSVRTHAAGIYAYRAGLAIPGTILWLLYFRHSRRVRATYGRT
jgi:hypothetical protein